MGMWSEALGNLMFGFDYNGRGLIEEVVVGAYEDYGDRVQDSNYLRGCARLDRAGTSDTEVHYSGGGVSLGLGDLSAPRSRPRPAPRARAASPRSMSGGTYRESVWQLNRRRRR
jgi:hypothetical protein